MKNSADLGGCCLPRVLSIEAECPHLALCFLLTKNKATSSPGFLGQKFNNLQRAALKTSF